MLSYAIFFFSAGILVGGGVVLALSSAYLTHFEDQIDAYLADLENLQ